MESLGETCSHLQSLGKESLFSCPAQEAPPPGDPSTHSCMKSASPHVPQL